MENRVFLGLLLVLLVAGSLALYEGFAYDFRAGDARNVSMYQSSPTRFTLARNKHTLPSRHSYDEGYLYYSDRARGGCLPEPISDRSVYPPERRNGTCVAVSKSARECRQCCALRTDNFVDHEQCNIYCGGLPGGHRPSFQPSQTLYG